jgi:hypothetical protein
VISGPGNIDYTHDMPPYVQEIVDWLDAPAKVHPCNGENAYKGFEIAMAICRPAVQRGKIRLPPGSGEPELGTLVRVLPDQTGCALPKRAMSAPAARTHHATRYHHLFKEGLGS